ncbi:MAG: methyltransferase domain-containing protein [Nitrososphaerota archaeon]|nr:methyltransferase domain-containing protein [Nitrososphaerota archaeon]
MSSTAESTPTLDILVGQAAPRLGTKGLSKEPRAGWLEAFFKSGGTWKDVFDASDVGAERNLVADKFVAENASVLDVGCGRGFFSFACATRSTRVVGVDPMDGRGRSGWWDEFKRTSAIMGHVHRVSGVRASATSIPLKDGSFQLVASVHSIRNFGGVEEIGGLVREAKRVLGKGGRLVVVESDLNDPGSPGYRAFYSMRTKMGWELDLPTGDEMARLLEVEGFSDVSQEFIETSLDYAPIRFPYDPSMPKGVLDGYKKAERLLDDAAEKPPRICMVSGSR